MTKHIFLAFGCQYVVCRFDEHGRVFANNSTDVCETGEWTTDDVFSAEWCESEEVTKYVIADLVTETGHHDWFVVRIDCRIEGSKP